MQTSNGTPQRWIDERLDQLAGIVSDLVDVQRQRDERVDRLTQAVTQLADVQLEFAQGMVALRVGQEQQARVLDYLLRKEQDRANGGS
jgi:hypothetical protein